jgi:uncharacterized protein (TIGR02391 family)
MAEVGADLWYSTWQTNDKRDGFRWANEQILFVTDPDGKFTFAAAENDMEYQWEGDGSVDQGSYLSGTWSSTINPASKGAFVLHNDDSQGKVRVGFLLGTNKDKRANYGAWVLVKASEPERDSALAEAKRALAHRMCPGIGDLIALSDGQFLHGFVHAKIAQSVLPQLAEGQPLAAVRTACAGLADHVRAASGITAADNAQLIKQAFQGTNGPLSKGELAPGVSLSSSQEQTNKEYLKELFLGSLLIRNIYGHNTVTTDSINATRIILLINYLLHLVDERAAASSTVP